MYEFFANSLTQGFSDSSVMGKLLVLLQLGASVVMYTYVFGKWWELRGLELVSRVVRRDVMSSQHVLDYYMLRKSKGRSFSPLDNIYWSTCERLERQMAPAARAQLAQPQAAPGAATGLSKHEIELVKSIGEQTLDGEEMRVEKGMGVIATVVALAPMVGLLGTVWGVLDAFRNIGAPGAGAATIKNMAPDISSALLTTVVGLLIAIPGIACHNILSAKLRRLQADMEGFLDDLTGRIALEFQDSGSRS